MLVLITNKQLRWVLTDYVQRAAVSLGHFDISKTMSIAEHKDSVDIRFFFPFYEKRCKRIQNLNLVYSIIIIREDIFIKRTKDQTKTLIHIPERAVSCATS